MSLAEAPFNQAVPKGEPLWSPREAAMRIAELQGQTVNLGAVLQYHMPNHVHFWVGETDKEPLPLQPESASAFQKSEPIDHRRERLTQAYRTYLQDHEIGGRVNIVLFDREVNEEPLFLEAIYPENEIWQPDKVIELFPMVDFAVYFHLSDKVRSAVKNGDSFYRYSFLTLSEPAVTINTTRIESTNLYETEVLFANRPVDEKKLKEYLECSIPFCTIYKDLGIDENIDALDFSEEGQRLVTALHEAKIG
ncbi:MAG TPA: hypothetical protein VLF68_04290 [Candidatus Saccharimonadales bacterium]|nr:hypothetical protein [Candidatus Saccharimonadales bacterium]